MKLKKLKMQEKGGGGTSIKIYPLHGRKVVMKMIYDVEDIFMLM